ncbi:hypothetical protein ACHDL8_003795 [Clostridioides difficile]|uniref:hypothetical protein n=1 Tax=Clostridioides difficile TaxID=1496 RepID=UPI00038CF794|nr:hypothetical protein [Clostridioides difficile]WMU95040.1 hypothetical protein NMPPGEIJ_00001 [Clostridioides phage AR1074-1]EGT3772713.1 hypothetical protein [Clostridioides difficile]EGT3805971.1 hypothetical protein [Clostridioides difficile]EGT3966818.1 hypothetical protein [Clostridioides difficile]EGT4832818.1 hypothetical protein [Clostridioides difficile]
MEINSVRELKELVELFGVIKAESNNVVSCNETVNELSNEELIKANENKFKKPWNDALLYEINALDIIKKHKHSDRKEKAYKTYLGLENADIEEIYKIHYGDKENSETVASCEEISSAKTDTISCNHDSVSKGKDTSDSECTCFICSKKIENQEDVFKIPFLTRDYLSSAKEIKNIEICEKCLDGNSWSIIRRKQFKKMKK